MIGCKARAGEKARADAGEKVDAGETVAVKSSGTGTSESGVVRGDWIDRLEVGDGGIAYVAPPVGAQGRRPIVVAIHGAVDDPGLMCGAWRIIADVYPFVVCPAGNPIGKDVPGRKYVWGSGEQIERRALEAVAAVEANYPEHVVAGAPVVYVAFSQGATMAAPLLVRNAARFPRAVLTEGAHHAFEPAGLARGYAKAGGERVLFTCSQAGCAPAFEASRAALERAGVKARVLFSGAHGHSMPPPVRESIHDALPFVVDGLAGWDGYATAPKLPSH
jgi:predicted esterase